MKQKQNIPLALLGFAILIGVVFTGAQHWIGKQLMAPLGLGADDMPYAKRMADFIIDSPPCDRFRQAILLAGKGPPTSAATKSNIINAYEEAKRYSCRKS
jgi:hypothetical protein